MAWSAGKQAFVRNAKGEANIDRPAVERGRARLRAEGLRLAVAHYSGVSLWFPNAEATPETLAWKGSHLDVAFSPDGRFLVTAMQDPMLHGWRLADAKDMRMSGYSAKVRSMAGPRAANGSRRPAPSNSSCGRSQSKDGPMGKQPRMLAPYSKRAVAVACHPKQEIIAVGFEDGLIMLCRIDDGAEILAKKPGAAPVSALAWSADGSKLAFGTENGEAGIADLA